MHMSKWENLRHFKRTNGSNCHGRKPCYLHKKVQVLSNFYHLFICHLQNFLHPILLFVLLLSLRSNRHSSSDSQFIQFVWESSKFPLIFCSNSSFPTSDQPDWSVYRLLHRLVSIVPFLSRQHHSPLHRQPPARATVSPANRHSTLHRGARTSISMVFFAILASKISNRNLVKFMQSRGARSLTQWVIWICPRACVAACRLWDRMVSRR